ncbi:MAG: hypothetical protein JHC87_07580 [Thermoleophilaceae bacterium]|nr:hypothetical protein [Thermoleophilaceae bacterium]
MAAEDSKGSKVSTRALLADVLIQAEQADRAAIARMSPSERLALALELSEFAARNATAVEES